jgi:hypothetical protein
MRIGSRRSLFSPSGPNFDPNASAYFEFAGITDPAEQLAANRLIVRSKGSGIWDRFDRLFLVSPTSEFASLTCCKTLNQMTNVNSVTWDSLGFRPNQSTNYLDSGFSITSIGNVSNKTSNCHGVYIPAAGFGTCLSLNVSYFAGVQIGTDISNLYAEADIGEIRFSVSGARVGRIASTAFQPGESFSGHFAGSINSSSLRTIYVNGTGVSNSGLAFVSTSDFPNTYFGVFNQAGTPVYGAVTRTNYLSGMYIGGSFSVLSMSSWNEIFTEYQTALGRP